MSEPDTFTLPPEGMLSEQVDLPDHEMSMGLLHIDGAGLRVCTWDGERVRHMSKAAALRLARELTSGPYATAMRPVADALEALVEKVGAIEARVASERLAAMEVEGRA